MYWQTKQRRRMGVEVTKFQYKKLLRMVYKREGNPAARVTLAGGFKVTLVKSKISQEADTSQTSQPA